MPPLTTTIAVPPPVGGVNTAGAAKGLFFGDVPITECGPFPPADTGGPCWVYVTLNAEIALELKTNDGLLGLLDTPRLRVSVDGQWLWWALRRKYPATSLRKLSGSDLIHRLARHCAEHGKGMLLVGSTPERNALAVARLRAACGGLKIDGFAPPHFDANQPADEAEVYRDIVQRIAQTRPDYVILGMGAHKEHRFAALHAPDLDGAVRGVLCFGGAIDMASGEVRRAPLAWQRCGLEGLYRVLQQPQRLGRLIRVTRLLPLLATGRY